MVANDFEIKDLGQLRYFIGMDVAQKQEQYSYATKKMHSKFDAKDWNVRV